MSTRRDEEFQTLGALGYTGSLRDREFKWLRAHGGSPATTVPDAWIKFLSFQTDLPLKNRADAELIFLKLALPPGGGATLLDGWLDFWTLGAPLIKP